MKTNIKIIRFIKQGLFEYNSMIYEAKSESHKRYVDYITEVK